MDQFENAFIVEDEFSIQNEEIAGDDIMQVEDCSENLNNLSGTCIQYDISNVCSGFTTNEIEIIQMCQDIYLKNALILNRKKKYLLLKTYDSLNNHKKNVQKQREQCKSSTVKESDWNKKLSKFRLGMPYFKDSQMYPSPFNEDYYKMKNNNEVPQLSYLLPRNWTSTDKCKLALSIYKSICNAKENDLKNQIETLQNHKDDEDNILDILIKELSYLKKKELIHNIASKWNTAKVLTDEEVLQRKDELRINIAYFQSQIVKGYNASYKAELRLKLKKHEEELNDIDINNYIISTVSTWNKPIDWLYISCNDVLRHDDIGCKVMWNSYLNPVNNKKAWTDEQNNELIQAVKKYKMQDWEQIAKELDINKSPLQCCIHFFARIWDKFRNKKWTKEEDMVLKSLINMFQVGDYIPWSKISKYFTERSKIQMYKHYYSVLLSESCKKGAFTLVEDILLCSLLRYYNSMTKASYFFKNRTLIQIRDRYNGISHNYRSWTFEDDVNILQHVEKYGEANWKIVNVGRQPDLVRHRYTVLKKWISEHPGENIKNVKRRKKSTAAQAKYLEKKYTLEKVVDQLLCEVKDGGHPELIFNMDHIQNVLNQTGYTKEKVRVKNSGRPANAPNLNAVMCEFLKFFYNFKGRQKTRTDFDSVKGAERIQIILNSLGANLNIPDVNTLQNNPLLDELDIKILTELSTVNKITDPEPSTSKTETVQSTQICKCDSSIPPDPVTLIGFRGLMMHVPQLKKHASNYYHTINLFLPEDSCYDVNLIGLNNTAKIISNQIKCLDKDKQVEVINERELFTKRFKSLFKWPAMMSLPSNAPPDNIFSGIVENTPKIINLPVKKTAGRPAKISPKVQRMLEARAKKKNIQDEDNPTAKKKKKVS